MIFKNGNFNIKIVIIMMKILKNIKNPANAMDIKK
jgi:hypothetical protein